MLELPNFGHMTTLKEPLNTRKKLKELETMYYNTICISISRQNKN